MDENLPTRDRLLASAVALLAERGSFDQVSLRAIASGAGVSPTAVYRHFSDHAALLDAVAAWCWEQFDAAVFGSGVVGSGDLGGEPAAEATNEEPIHRFRRQGLAYVAFARDNPGIYRALMDCRFDDVSRADDGLSVYAKLVTMVGEVLAANGDDRDPERVALLVHTWIHGIATIHLPGRDNAPEPTSWSGIALDQPASNRAASNQGALLDELALALGLVPAS